MDSRQRPIGAVPSTQVPRYAGKGTFARIADINEVGDYDIAVLGVPFDGGTSYRPGARFGPLAVRQAARALRPGYHVELGVAPLEVVQIVDAGDVTVTPYDITEACTQIQNRVQEVMGDRGRRIVSIGGDHTIALPNLRALHRKHGPIALVHFDAHLDTWDTYFNAPVTHERSSGGLSKRGCSSRTTRSTSAFADRSTTAWTSPTTPAWASRSFARVIST